jgi:hypothetical protein
MIQNMFKTGIKLEEISKITGLPLEKVRELLEK